jgi:tetratricopeptide (TPR) repeat protein
MKKKLSLIAVIFFFFTCIPQFAFANVEEAKKSFQEGTRYYNDGEFLRAAEAFRKAYEIRPIWKLLFNIAQAEAAAKRYGLALEAFESYMARGGDEVSLMRSEEVMTEMTRLRMLVSVLEVDAPDGISVLIDNYKRATLPASRPIRVAVGKHEVKLMMDGRLVYQESVEVVGNVTASVRYAPEEMITETVTAEAAITVEENDGEQGTSPILSQPTQADKRRKIFLASAISAAALAVGGITMGIIGSAKFSKDNNDWETAADDYRISGSSDDYNDAHSAHSDAQSDLNMLKVGFILGGIFTAGSVVLFSFHRKKESAVAVTPSCGGISITF